MMINDTKTAFCSPKFQWKWKYFFPKITNNLGIRSQKGSLAPIILSFHAKKSKFLEKRS
jgi:hypothetical protein